MNQNFHQHRPISDKHLPAKMERGWRGWFALLDRWEQLKRDVASRVNGRLNRQHRVPVRVKVEIRPDRR